MTATSQAPAGLHDVVEHLGHLLPAQGPIGVFIHHNTLHAFQHLPFEEAVVTASRLFQAEPYMAEAAYRAAFAAGRITPADIEAVVGDGPHAALRLALLVPGPLDVHIESIHWALDEQDVTGRFRTDLPGAARRALEGASPRALFDAVLDRTPLPGVTPRVAVRPRDGVLTRTGDDTDEAIHPLLIRLSAAFLDQGLAYWPMPHRELGFWAAAQALLAQTAVLPAALSTLPRWLAEWRGLDAAAAVTAALGALGVSRAEWESVLQAELLALPGWAGMMRQLELDPGLAPHEAVAASLMDFLAVRLLLTVSAVSSRIGEPSGWRNASVGPAVEAAEHADRHRLLAAVRGFDAAQLSGYSATRVRSMSSDEWAEFRRVVDTFDGWARRSVWHAAYERRHERRILLPLQQHAARGVAPTPGRLAAQVFFCIDEREESIRRHLEEIDPEIETFGAAGFFGVAMHYTGLDDAGGAALCPVIVKPGHTVTERPAEGHQSVHEERRMRRRAWARLARHGFVSSRTLLRGWVSTTLLGVFTVLPLAGRLLDPRRYARFVSWLNAAILPEPRTELAFMRDDAAGHEAAEGLLRGFTVVEKADRVASVLGPAGLRKGMARLVVILGHGSTSLNNPHESAHDCGACGGRRGGPNARLFAAMANHPQVRAALRDRGISIPDDTWFVGGYHDTCNDDVDLYDTEAVPASHRQDLARVTASLDGARAASAHERARRFEAASSSRRFQAGLHHVQGRAEHLAEPRPEYGHCTNAVCIIGRRANTRGLFLDRRAFLVSYDALQDSDDSNLARLLGAAIPVCAGISLEYYFSFVDNERYGCGTKLPHNVTGLVGVMNGNESDLRTGLPWQMVEIHEPVRILFVVETTPARVLATIRATPLLAEFLDNRWIRLATVDPVDGTSIHVYRGDGQWEAVEGLDERLADADSSVDFYHGKLEHLPIARIRSAA